MLKAGPQQLPIAICHELGGLSPMGLDWEGKGTKGGLPAGTNTALPWDVSIYLSGCYHINALSKRHVEI